MPEADLAQAEARLPRWMAACAAVGSLLALGTGHRRAGVGFALGAGVAILNYLWLHEALVALFAAGKARIPRAVAVKLLLRYPLALAGLYLFYRTGWLPAAAILAGLFVPVAGVLIEAMVQIRAGLRA